MKITQQVRESLAGPHLCRGSPGHEIWLLMYLHFRKVQLRVQKTHSSHLNALLILLGFIGTYLNFATTHHLPGDGFKEPQVTAATCGCQ